MTAVPTRYRHIVVGAGAIGTGAAFWLSTMAPRGEVLVIEQFGLGHSRGASEDHSRIIRHAYHSTDYTNLTRASYDTWHDIEERSGVPLVQVTGGLDLAVGDDGLAMLDDYGNALGAVGLDHERLGAPEVMARWPQWRLPDDVVGLYQAESGILDIRRANAAHVALARAAGVEFAEHTRVLRIHDHGSRIELVTGIGRFEAETLTICAGSWLGPLVEGLGLVLPITLSQEQVTYWSSPNLRDFAPDRFGVWIFHGPEKTFYGFPVYGEVAVKAARDMSGVYVDQYTRSWAPDPGQRDQVLDFLSQYLPGAVGPELYTKTCVYDMPPDRNFIVDFLPGQPRITVCCGAGHAAKFASLLGKVLAEMAVDGSTKAAIEPFRVDRPAIVDPHYPCEFRFASTSPV